MRRKLSSRNKILIASILFGWFAIATIASIILVFAANIQSVSTNIGINYVVDGVGVKTSATYTLVPYDSSKESKKVSMTSEGNDYIEFDFQEENAFKEIGPTENLILDQENRRIVFEYIFESTSDAPFSIRLASRPSGNNITEKFLVSGTRLGVDEYNKINGDSLAIQALTSYESTAYIYISVSIINTNRNANYDGEFIWIMENQNTIDVKLNTDGVISTLKVIPTTEVADIAMPIIKIPTKDGYLFSGYYTNTDGNGTQYITNKGTSTACADIDPNSTLFAYFQLAYIIEGDSIVDLTDAGASAETLVVPSSVTTIGSESFKDSSVKNVVVSNSVQKIETNAFENCTSLEKVVIGDGESLAYADEISALKTVGSCAFKNCTALKEIVIPSSVTSFGTTPFSGCTALEKIEFPYVLGVGTISSSSFVKLFGTTDDDIPAGIDVVICGTTAIPNYAFYGCSKIGNVTILGTVQSIGIRAFESSSIVSINIHDGLTTINSRSFAYCQFLTNAIIPSSVTFIHSNAFSGASNLVQVKKLSGQTMGGYTAPSYAEVLTEEGEFVGSFSENNKYKYFLYNSQKVLLHTKDKNMTTANDIDADTTIFGNSCFYEHNNLLSLTVPKYITAIGSQTFNGVYSISHLRNLSNLADSKFSPTSHAEILKNDTDDFLSRLDIGKKYAYLYKNNNKILARVIDNSIVVVNDIDEDVTMIGAAAIYNKDSITKIIVPNSVKYVYGYAFSGCDNLSNITLSSSLTTIEGEAFRNLPKLLELTIPASVKQINAFAFRATANLTSVTFENPEGWSCVNAAGASATFTAEELSDPATAATKIITYMSYKFKCSEDT